MKVQKSFGVDDSYKYIQHVLAENVLKPDQTNGDYDELVGEVDLGQDDDEGTHRIWSRDLLIPPSGSNFGTKLHQIMPVQHFDTIVSLDYDQLPPIPSLGLKVEVR